MSQSGDSLAQKSGSFPDRHAPANSYSSPIPDPHNSQLHVRRKLSTRPHAREEFRSSPATAGRRVVGEGGSTLNDGSSYRSSSTNPKYNRLRSSSGRPLACS